MERRLAAILAADVVGYTRLMGVDEVDTLRRLTDLREKVLEPLITEHHGRVVKLMGDGLLVEFASAVDSVACAIAWQDNVALHETDRKAGTKLLFRIGINLGDIIVEGGDIHGDGVNIAARLESLAQPGGICLSDDIVRHAKGNIETQFEDIGEQSLKNVADPVRVYRVTVERPAATATPAAVEHLPLPDKPSIAVVPFINMSGDPDQEFFADGITDDIITELSKYRSLFVIGRNSSFVYKGKQVRSQDVGLELGVAFIVEGSVRTAGQRVRVSARLVEAATGNQLWTERYDRQLEDIFAVQDELTQAITAILPVRLDGVAHERASRKPAANLSAYEYYLRGRWYWHQDTTDMTRVLDLFERAVAADPNLARAHADMAVARAESLFFDATDAQETERLALNGARAALAADLLDSSVQAKAAIVYLMCGQFDLARSHAALAMEINPNDIDAIGAQGAVCTYTGVLDEGLLQFQKLWRLDPQHPGVHYEGLVECYYYRREFSKAVDAFRRWRNPSAYMMDIFAAALAQNGELDAAYAVREAFFEGYPDRTIHPKTVAAHLRMIEQREYKDLMLEGYRLAGFEV